jgi:hypothetical protein
MPPVKRTSWVKPQKQDRRTGKAKVVGVPAAIVTVPPHRTGLAPGQTRKVVRTNPGFSFHYPDRSIPANPDPPWNGRTKTVPGERESTTRPERFAARLETKIGKDLADEVMGLIAGTPVPKHRVASTPTTLFFGRSYDNCRTQCMHGVFAHDDCLAMGSDEADSAVAVGRRLPKRVQRQSGPLPKTNHRPKASRADGAPGRA